MLFKSFLKPPILNKFFSTNSIWQQNQSAKHINLQNIRNWFALGVKKTEKLNFAAKQSILSEKSGS